MTDTALTTRPLLAFADTRLVLDSDGSLFWPDEQALIVADLHFEKGSAFAARGIFLPPYDTRATLDALSDAMNRHRPRRVICLGDSFHDGRAGERMGSEDADRLNAMTRSAADWLWITGNHDPVPPVDLGGRIAPEEKLGPMVLRHKAVPGATFELSGHLHPSAALRVAGRRIRDRCFVTDGIKLILPSFGAFTGGLSALDPAISGLLQQDFDVHLLAQDRVHRFPRHRLCP